jgi:hypothetical protein
VDFFFGLNVYIAFAKYEKIEAEIKAIELDTNAIDKKNSSGIRIKL